MSEVRVREATVADAEALAPLLEVLGYPADPAVLRGRLASLRRDDPTGRVLVADLEGRVLGVATLHLTPVLHRPTPVGRITALAVLREAHGTGVGRRLVAEAERYFAEAGLGRVEVTSGRLHEDAYGFYRHLGYADHGVRFAKVI